MQRAGFVVYGVAAYAIFLAVFLYLIGFLANAVVPKSIDSGARLPLAAALAIDLGLLWLFAVQHSVMARSWFKRWWTQWVPEAVERSTYVMATNLVLVLLYWQWQPIDGTVWQVQAPVLRGLLWSIFALGWAVVLYTTFLIDHFDLFGLKQVYLHVRSRVPPPPHFVTPHLYRLVRHPLYLDWLLCFWATPDMSLGHLVFSLGTTVYIFRAIPLEEADLAEHFGERYREYRQRTPMILPRLRRR